MRVLAFDTTGQSCSVAVSDDQGVVAEQTLVSRETHSRHLMVMIHRTLAMAGTDLDAMDALAVTVGPGSFTGIRIGLSTAQALAMATGRPVAGVSTLAALARPYRWIGLPVVALLDARRGETYYGRYRPEGQGDAGGDGTEGVGPPDMLLETVSEPSLFVGTGARLYAQRIAARLGDRARFPSGDHHIPRAAAVAELGRQQLRCGPCRKDLQQLMPAYLRPADAERNRAAARAGFQSVQTKG